jgi:hypothetical protein
MSKTTVSGVANDEDGESLFCTPPPEERDAIAEAAFEVEAYELHVAEMQSPRAEQEEALPTVRAKGACCGTDLYAETPSSWTTFRAFHPAT